MNSNLVIAQAFVKDVWNDARLDRIPDLMHEDYAAEGRVVGHALVRNNVTTFRSAFPDLQTTILTSSCEGDVVAALVRMWGTHLGTWGSLAATGNPIDIREAAFWRIRDGRIASGEFVAEALKTRIQAARSG